MWNRALAALWVAAVLAVIVGVGFLIAGSSGDGMFDQPNYAQMYTGSGLISFGFLCAMTAITVMAIGYYVDRARQDLLRVLAPPKPLPVDDALRDSERRRRYSDAAKKGALSWSGETE